MVAPNDALDLSAVARDVCVALASHRQIPVFSSRPGGLTLADAYRVTPLLRAAFEARGERIIGRKIGFTNREMWKVYGVDAPVWGYVTDRTTHALADAQFHSSKDFIDPRIEPEIIFGLKAAPSPGMDEAALLDCIDWVALGYEIVQSIFPKWKFTAADTVAANGLHGALLVGPRHAIAVRTAEWQRELATFEVELYCNGKLSQRGGGALVLGSPLLALRHLVELLANDPHNPPLRAGEIISTGTLTLAMPVRAGETIAENEVLLRCIDQDWISTLARMADPEEVPALHRGIGAGLVKARLVTLRLAWAEPKRVEAIMPTVSDEEYDRPFTPNWFPPTPKDRDELETWEAAQRDLKRLERYGRRAWSRRRRAIRNLIAWRVQRASPFKAVKRDRKKAPLDPARQSQTSSNFLGAWTSGLGCGFINSQP